MTQGIGEPLGIGKGKEMDSLQLAERTSPSNTLILAP